MQGVGGLGPWDLPVGVPFCWCHERFAKAFHEIIWNHIKSTWSSASSLFLDPVDLAWLAHPNMRWSAVMLPQLWIESLNTCWMPFMHMHHNPKGPFHTHVENLCPSLAAILAWHVFCSESNGNCGNFYWHCFACQHNCTSRADIFEGCECACEVA